MSSRGLTPLSCIFTLTPVQYGNDRVLLALVAWSLKRAGRRKLQDPLVLKLLQGEFHEGQIKQVDFNGAHWTFAPAPEAVSA
jgi:hypothetical protein